MIKAVLMAGGKGKRMNLNSEKPLFKIYDKPLIDHVLANLENSIYIDDIIIAVSPNTPKTKKYLSKNSFNCLKTPGNGYLEDLSFILSYFEKLSKEDILLFINADLPFISTEIIDYVIGEYIKNNFDALSVFVPLSIFNKYGIKPSFIIDDLVPSGLNILLSRNEVQNEYKLIIPKIELALNINTTSDAKLAYSLFENNQI